MQKSTHIFLFCVIIATLLSCKQQPAVPQEEYDKLSRIIVEKDMEIDSLKQVILSFQQDSSDNTTN